MEPLERRVYGRSGAEHGRRKLGRQTRRYLNDKVRGRAMVERVPALCLAAIAVLASVGDDATSAVVFALLGALHARVVGIAVEARISLGPDAHNVADLDVSLRLGANPDGDPDDFVPDDDWVRDITLPLSVRGSCQGIPFSSSSYSPSQTARCARRSRRRQSA